MQCCKKEDASFRICKKLSTIEDYTRKDASDMNHKTLGNIFQEISDEFSDMGPVRLDKLEDKVLSAMCKLGSYLMESKIRDWSDQVRNETCPECGTKLEHKRKKRQIATWVSDVSYKRWRSYCPECRKYEYPLDTMLGISPKQQSSSSIQELSALCGASWDYKECEYLIQKILRRRCVRVMRQYSTRLQI